MLWVNVAFASTVECHIRAMYIGEVPEAEQESISSGYARKSVAESGNIILGEANK